MSQILPTEQIVSIVRQIVSKYRRHNHPDYEDFVQDVLLGVFERLPEYDPTRGKETDPEKKPARFVAFLAHQKANDRNRESKRQRDEATMNHRSRVPYRIKIREVGEADQRGRLGYNDPSLRLSRIRQLLDPEQERFLSLLRSGADRIGIERKMNISAARSQEIASELQEIFATQSSPKNIF